LGTGVWLYLLFALYGPSFWYLGAAGFIGFAGILFVWRPALGAPSAFVPVAVLLIRMVAFDHGSREVIISIVALTICVSISVGFFLAERKWRLTAIVLLCSSLLLGIEYAVDRLFTNQLRIKRYAMRWALDGRIPWKQPDSPAESQQASVFLYKEVDGGYCYDEIRSAALISRLQGRSDPTLIIEYNTYVDFESPRSYNVRSVDGLMFNDDKYVVREHDHESGRFGGAHVPMDCPPFDRDR
jgi:hypothetical protein